MSVKNNGLKSAMSAVYEARKAALKKGAQATKKTEAPKKQAVASVKKAVASKKGTVQKKGSAQQNRPTSRQKRRRTWGDVVEGYNYSKDLNNSESAAGASWRIHDPDSPLRKVKNPKKQANAGMQSRMNYMERKGGYGVHADKRYPMTPSSDFDTSWSPILNNTETSSVSAKATADSWKVTPKEERKTERLIPQKQAYGGGYWATKPKTWKEANRRYNAMRYGDSVDQTLRQSSITGTDSPMARLELEAAGIDHQVKNARQRYAMLKARQEEEKRERVSKVKRSVKAKAGGLKEAKNDQIMNNFKRRKSQKYRKRWSS